MYQTPKKKELQKRSGCGLVGSYFQKASTRAMGWMASSSVLADMVNLWWKGQAHNSMTVATLVDQGVKKAYGSCAFIDQAIEYISQEVMV